MVPPPPLPATQPGRPSLQVGDPPRAAPRPPCAGRQCEDQEAHICLHSDAPSDRSGGSVGSQCHHSEGPGTTGAAPRLPPAVTQKPCHVGRWVQASDPGAQEPASPTAAEEELPPHYTGSVTSSINSRQGLSVGSMLRKLHKCISNMQNTGDMGEKLSPTSRRRCQAWRTRYGQRWTPGKNWSPDLWQKLRQP